MANVIRLKRASGSDPTASDLVSGEPAVRTDTGELFFKKDDGSVAKVSGAGGGPDFKYLALRNAANNGVASYPNADFTLVKSGTTTAITPTAANTLLVSVNGVIQRPNTGTSTPSEGFALNGSTIKFGGNISAAPDFILYQESGGIGEPSDDTVSEVKLKVSNSPVNGYFLSAQSGNTGGLTWAAPVATSCTGNSATATALATARTINGTSFDGTANITVTAAAGTLTGTTLNSSVTASSLTSLGDLAGLTVVGNVALDNATNAGRDVQWQHANDRLAFFDNTKATFGNGADLQIYHDGTNSFIQDTAGASFSITATESIAIKTNDTEFAIACNKNGGVELYHNNSKKFETTAIGVTISGDLKLPDGEELRLGNSNDIQFYHDGTHSYLENNTGNLRIRNNGTLKTAQFEVDQVDFNDSANTQVRVRINSDGLRLPQDNDKIQLGAGNDLQIYHNGSSSVVDGGAVPLYIAGDPVKITDSPINKDMAIFNKNAAVELYYNGGKKFETTSSGATVTGSLGIGTTSPSQKLQVTSGNILLDGTDQFIYLSNDADQWLSANAASNYLRIGTGNAERMRIDSSGNVFIGKTSSDVNVTGVELKGNGNNIFTRNNGIVTTFNRGTNNGQLISLQRSGFEGGTINITPTSASFNSGSSDRSVKKNFEDWTENTLDLFKKLNPQKFNYIIEDDGAEKNKGYIAQDLVDSFPEAYPKNDNNKYMFNPSGMVVYLMKAVQELTAKVEALEAK